MLRNTTSAHTIYQPGLRNAHVTGKPLRQQQTLKGHLSVSASTPLPGSWGACSDLEEPRKRMWSSPGHEGTVSARKDSRQSTP